MIQQARVKFTGTQALMTVNSQTADPLSEAAKAMKELTSRRKKTDQDYEDMALLEMKYALYLSNGQMVLPRENLMACLIGGAKKLKLGKLLPSAVCVLEDAVIKHDGPTDPEKFIRNAPNTYRRVVRQMTSSVCKSRPIFHKWSVEFDIEYEEDFIDKRELEQVFTMAGRMVGVGAYTRLFGRFSWSWVK